ncbi:uncharacterized protein PG998_004343 [Apiospora kogelbergensis]|uniref:uncharacterized protein n=1 Tax=Apiospora kogelbergensis TaxID=1337665 RepID=UPI00312F42A5
MATRESLSLGGAGPTLGSRPTTAISISLPESLGDFSSGFSWDIPHLNDLDIRKSNLSEQAGGAARSSGALNQPPPPTSEREEKDQPTAAATASPPPSRRDEQPLSNAINIILARSRAYEPLRKKNEEPWWATRSEEEVARAEKARSNMQDQVQPEGAELYFIYPWDTGNSQQTHSIEKHLEGAISAYAMQRSNLFEGVLFWRAYLTKPEMETIQNLKEVYKLEHQPKPDLEGRRKLEALPDYTPSRKNEMIMYETPPPGSKLYQIEPEKQSGEELLRPLVDQLEAMAGEGRLYTSLVYGGILFWHAFLTETELEQVKTMKGVGTVQPWLPTDCTGDEYDPAESR